MQRFTRNNKGRFAKKAKVFGARPRNERGRFTKKNASKTKKNRPRNKLGRWLGF